MLQKNSKLMINNHNYWPHFSYICIIHILLLASCSPLQHFKENQQIIDENIPLEQPLTQIEDPDKELTIPVPPPLRSEPVYWQSEFSNSLNGIHLDIDQSVGCEEFPAEDSDLSIKQVEDRGAPSGSHMVLEQTANVNKRNGIFTNAIGSVDIEFQDDSRYTFEGYFKKVDGSQPEMININIDLVEDYEERYAEIIWGMNKYSPLNGWIYTRGPDFSEIKLFKLPVDTKWHFFQIIVEYQSEPKSRKIVSIKVDENQNEINLEMGRSEKSWPFAFRILFETHNMYTGCKSGNTFIGVSRWDGLRVFSVPIY